MQAARSAKKAGSFKKKKNFIHGFKRVLIIRGSESGPRIDVPGHFDKWACLIVACASPIVTQCSLHTLNSTLLVLKTRGSLAFLCWNPLWDCETLKSNVFTLVFILGDKKHE